MKKVFILAVMLFAFTGAFSAGTASAQKLTPHGGMLVSANDGYKVEIVVKYDWLNVYLIDAGGQTVASQEMVLAGKQSSLKQLVSGTATVNVASGSQLLELKPAEKFLTTAFASQQYEKYTGKIALKYNGKDITAEFSYNRATDNCDESHCDMMAMPKKGDMKDMKGMDMKNK
jgi:hypothetical protein